MFFFFLKILQQKISIFIVFYTGSRNKISLPSKPSINPFPDDKFYPLPNLEHFADDNFKFDENDGKFFNRVENTVGKGGIARYEQFLLFPQCFQDFYSRNVETSACLGKGLHQSEGLASCTGVLSPL